MRPNVTASHTRCELSDWFLWYHLSFSEKKGGIVICALKDIDKYHGILSELWGSRIKLIYRKGDGAGLTGGGCHFYCHQKKWWYSLRRQGMEFKGRKPPFLFDFSLVLLFFIAISPG